MSFFAKDIMVTNFDVIHREASVEEAIRMISAGKVRPTGHKTVSLLVVDDFRKLTGVITMFDILYHLRPSFLNYGVNSDEIGFEWDVYLERFISDLKSKRVEQIMSEDLISAKPEDHLMVVLDRMIKNKYRRLPIIKEGKPIGVVYISDVYTYLFAKRV
jgi:CBS domain-containing protein